MTGNAGALAPPRGIGSAQVILLATMVALDFAFGWVAKPLMQALGLATFLHVEMIPPVMLILLSRLTLDRFGVLIAYEAAWALVAIVAMPGGVLPGPLKLVPLLATGLVMDASFSAFRRWGTARVFVAAVAGGFAGAVSQGSLRILLGLPWAKSTQVYIGIQLLGGVVVHASGAFLAVLVWRRVWDHQALQWLKVGP